MLKPSQTAPYPESEYRWREYEFDVEHLDAWTVVPLIHRVRELVQKHAGDALEFVYDVQCEVRIKFESRETTDDPQFSQEFGQKLDDELLIGAGWRCLKTHGYTSAGESWQIDELERAMQRAPARVSNDG